MNVNPAEASLYAVNPLPRGGVPVAFVSGDRLAVPGGRRDLVQRRHDHRLHCAEEQAQDDRANAHQPGAARR